MPGPIVDLLAEVSVKGVKEAQGQLQGFGRSVGDVEKTANSAFGVLNKGFAALGISLGSAALVGGIANLTTLGARAETVGMAFGNMTKSIGQDTGAMLAKLKSASRGAIAETDLMVAANRAIIMGGDQLASRLPELMQLARAASIATGQDMQYMLDSIVLGIARRSRLILDNLGIIVDLDKANQNFAKSVGKSADALTDEEQVSALLNDVLRVMPDYIKSVGAEATTSAEKVQGFKASLTDLKEEAGKMIAEGGGADVAGFFANAFRLWTEQNQYKQMLREQVAAFDPNLAANWAARFTNTIGTTPTFSNEAIEKNRAALQRMVAEAQKYIDTQKAMAASEKQKRDAIEASVAIMRGAIPGTDSYNVAVQRLGKSAANTAATLRLMGQATQYASMAQAGASYADGITNPERLKSKDYRPGYVFASDYWTKIGAQQGEARRAGEQHGQAYTSGVSSAFSQVQSQISSALGARMSPTQGDFLSTAAGTYQNAPLESVRRLDAIVARGFSELKAHADWASVLNIPPDVLAGSEAGLKAWAADTRDAAAAMARPDMVNWDAFLSEFDRLSALEAGKAEVQRIAMQKLQESGRIGGKGNTDKILQQMFGFDSPEQQGASIATSLATGMESTNPAGAFLAAFKSGIDQQRSVVDSTGKMLGEMIGKSTSAQIVKEIGNGLAGAQFQVTVNVEKLQPQAGGAQVLP